VQGSRRVGEHEHTAAAKNHAAVGRGPGEELGELGAHAPLVEVHALDRLAREHRRGPRQAADEPAQPLRFGAGGGKRGGKRAVEERHTQRFGDARGDEVSRRAVLGRHRHDGSVGRRRAGVDHSQPSGIMGRRAIRCSCPRSS
jgi:hypothetical protein